MAQQHNKYSGGSSGHRGASGIKMGGAYGSGGGGNPDEILPFPQENSSRPSTSSSSFKQHTRQSSGPPKLTRLDFSPSNQPIPSPQRRSKSPRVWMESSFVGVKPIASPETPSGDVASFVFDDPSLLNGLGNDGGYGNELVPMVKLRSGSAQLDAYIVGRELELRNGHFHSRKPSSASEQNLSFTNQWSMPERKPAGNGNKLHSSNQSFNTLQDRYDSSDFSNFKPTDSKEIAATAAMLSDGLQKRMFSVDPDELPASVKGNATKPGNNNDKSNPSSNYSQQPSRKEHSRSPSRTKDELERRGSTSLDDVLSSLLALPSSPANKPNESNDRSRSPSAAGSSTSQTATAPNGSLVVRQGSLRRPTSQPDLENRGDSPGKTAPTTAYGWRNKGMENSPGGSRALVNTFDSMNRSRLDNEEDRISRSISPLSEDESSRMGLPAAAIGVKDATLPSQRHLSASGPNRVIPSPEPFFFEDLEIRVMPKDAIEGSSNSSSSTMGLPAGNKGFPTGLQPLNNILIKCRNGSCSNSCPLEEAQQVYKTCRNCHTYYCSRECRRAHRPRHVRHCVQLKASALLTELMHQIRDIKEVYLQLSKVAKQGYSARGFGCVKLFFQTVEDLEEFLDSKRLDKASPGYLAVQDLLPEEMGPDNFKSLVDMCQTYNPDTKMVLYAAVCIWSEVPGSENTKFERLLIVKCVKMKLSPVLSPRHQSSSSQSPHRSPRVPAINPIQLRQEAIITRDVEDQETLIIASKGPATSLADKRLARTVVLNTLLARGVQMAAEFPDVARKLDAYAEAGHHFGHVIFYPRDQDTQNVFMCIIMLELDSERFRSLPRDVDNLQFVAIGDD